MSNRIVWAINTILILTIIAICVWAFPYATSAFYLSRGRKAFEAAQESPDGLELYARAFDDLQQAVRWDEDNTEASNLLTQASRPVAQVYVEEGRFAEARPVFEAMLEQDPENQFALYYLARIYEEEGEAGQAAEIYQTLRYFELEENGKPPSYLGDLVAKLEQYGLWEREQVVNVVSYLVWQEVGEQVEELLTGLEEKYPGSVHWPFYWAEMYHRQGNLEQAGVMYRQVLEIEPKYAQAYLRLGMVTEEKGRQREGETKRRNLREAAKWYEQYHDLATDALLGLDRLVEVCAALEEAGVEDESCHEAAERVAKKQGNEEAEEIRSSPAAALREELEAKTNDRRVVAELLDVPVEDVELGPNLVENGGFEEWENTGPADWRLGTYLGQNGGEGLYVAGKDTLVADGETARIITLWGGAMPDRTTTYAEYVGDTLIVTNTEYLVSLHYASQYLEGTGLVFLGEYTRSDGLVLVHTGLPDSDGQWTVIHILVDGPPAPTVVMPLVRNWGVGQLWVDELEIRPIVRIERLHQ